MPATVIAERIGWTRSIRASRDVGSCEEGGNGAFAVGGDQLGNVAFIEAAAQAPRVLRVRSRGHTQSW